MIWLIDAFVIGFSKSKRGIGNIASKTKTVWKEENIILRLSKIFIGIAFIAVFFMVNIGLNSKVYSNTDIYRTSLEVVKIIKANGNDKSVGGIQKYDYLPLQVQIKNESGFVILKYKDDSNNEKYLYLEFKKQNDQWLYVKGSQVDKKPQQAYSIQYSKTL